MDVSDLKSLTAEVKKRMDAQLEHVRREFSGVRTGRASVTILDTVHVEAYGSHMPLNQVASLSIPEPTMIVAQPFDPSLTGTIEKAIRAANLGLNPATDGKAIRIPLPPLTEERRKELSKLVPRLPLGPGAGNAAVEAGIRRAERERAQAENRARLAALSLTEIELPWILGGAATDAALVTMKDHFLRGFSRRP